MQITIKLTQISYTGLVQACLPLIKGGRLAELNGSPLAGLAAMPPATLCAALDALPQQTKDEAAAALIRRYKRAIIDGLTQWASQNGVNMTIGDLTAQA